VVVVVSFLYLVEIFFSDSGAAFANLSLVKMNPKYCFLTKGLCFQTIHRTHLIKEGFVNPAPDSDSVKEARNSFFGLGVYLLKSKFRIEDKLRFP